MGSIIIDDWANAMERRCYRALAHLDIEFYPQYPIGRYRADAFLPKHKIVVEFDDPSHGAKQRQIADEIRDEYMAQLGYYTLRITYKELRRDVVGVLKRSLERIGVPTRVRMGHCTLSVDEIVTIECRQHMYLCGYTEAASMLFPVFRRRDGIE